MERKEWANMTQSEKTAAVTADRKAAVEKAKTLGLPSGVRITVAGRTLRLDPVRPTATGVTYSLNGRATPFASGDLFVRPNRASFTLSKDVLASSNEDEGDLL